MVEPKEDLIKRNTATVFSADEFGGLQNRKLKANQNTAVSFYKTFPDLSNGEAFKI